VSVEVDDLTQEDLLAAAGRGVTTLVEEPPFPTAGR
jgi:hypothetical protein